MRVPAFIAALLASSAIAAEPQFKANPAVRKIVEAPDLAAVHDQALRNKVTPDERYFLSEEMRECAYWRGAKKHFKDNRTVTHDPATMKPGKSRDAALLVRKRCAYLTLGAEAMLAEADRLRSEAIRDKSIPALGGSLPELSKTNPRKAADDAITVLESGDAEAIRALFLYIRWDHAWTRMKDDVYANVGYLESAWEIYFCTRGADCGAGSRNWREGCLFGTRCEDTPFSEKEFRATSRLKDDPRIDTYLLLIDDIFRRRQWDRLGIRAARYPWVENMNQEAPRRYKSDGTYTTAPQ